MRRLWPLAVVAAAVTLLGALGLLPRWSGLPQLVALPPLDHFADLRILLAMTTSVPAFVGLLVLVLAIRVVVLAALLGGLDRARLWFAAKFYLAVFPVLFLAAVVDFASYAVLYSRMFWVMLGVVAGLVLVAVPVPWQRPEGWRLHVAVGRTFRDGLRVSVTVPYALLVIGVGGLAEVGGPAGAVLLVPVSALVTGVAIQLLSRVPERRPLLRLAAVGVALAVLVAGFVATREVAPPPPPPDRAGSLLLMSGINSSSGNGSIFEADVADLGYDCEQVYYYSYAGPGDGAPQGDATCPIRTGAPYTPDDTERPLAELVEIFAAQVADLPRPLVVAGHSLAAWVAWQAVATGRAPEVDVLVLVGPFPDSPVGYPPPGQTGPGHAAGELLRLLAPLAARVDFHFDPDAPSSRELLATSNASRAVFGQPLPDRVRSLSITSAADLPLMPGGWRLPVDRNACPVRETHPLLPETPRLYHEVNRFLDGRAPPPCPVWRDWGAPLALPFGLPPTANP